MTFLNLQGDEIVAQSDRVKVVLREEPNQIYYSALEIKEPTKDKDVGQFVCTAKNESGKLTATFTVKFEGTKGSRSYPALSELNCELDLNSLKSSEWSLS